MNYHILNGAPKADRVVSGLSAPIILRKERHYECNHRQ